MTKTSISSVPTVSAVNTTVVPNQTESFAKPKSIIIGIMNQKGGVGKTTITTLLANLFNFYFHYRVAIIDADMPQHSIIKRRKEELKQINRDPKLKGLLKRLYKGILDKEKMISPIDIIPADFTTVNNILAKHKSNYDIIFIDMAGTINQKGIIDVLKNVHHFFIPVLEDSDTLMSSFEFYSILDKYIIQENSVDKNFRSAHFFFNRIGHMNQTNKIKAKIENVGSLLGDKVYNYKAYERKLRSTVFPIPLQTERNPFNKEANLLLSFAKSVLQIIEHHYATKNTLKKEEVKKALI